MLVTSFHVMLCHRMYSLQAITPSTGQAFLKLKHQFFCSFHMSFLVMSCRVIVFHVMLRCRLSLPAQARPEAAAEGPGCRSMLVM
jgi:hypothetical protein